jgi:hypothetical protein
MLGNTPNKNIVNSSGSSTINSRRVTSIAYPRYGLHAPLHNRAYNQIEYAADKIIPELIARPASGLRWIVPSSAKNSPAQLTVRGVPMFPRMNRKKIAENTGMYSVRPR